MSLLGKSIAPVVLGLGWALAFGAAQDAAQTTAEALDALVESAREEQELDAIAVIISIGEETLHSSALGVTPEGSRKRTELYSPFEAGALAHVWLSTIVMQQRAKGEVALDQELGKLLPDLVGEDCPVHVANLLNHTSGFADYTDFVELEAQRSASYAELLVPIKAQPLITEPSECVAKSPTNTLLLAALVEKLVGVSAASAIEARIFDELGMSSSGYEWAQREAAAIEAASDGATEDEPAMFMAGLHTSARDLVRFQRALVDHELLGSDDLDAMMSATRLLDGASVPSGMGIRRVAAGGSEGFAMGNGGAAVAYFPEHDLTLSVIGRGDDARLDRLALRLAERVIEVPEPLLADLYLNESEMRPYLGTYAIGCNTLVIRPETGRIVLDRTDEGADVLLYQGAHRFVARADPGLVLVFEVEGPRASSFTMDDHGMRSIATRFDD